MESSDWPTLITTGAARDYAEKRFREHAEAFDRLQGIWANLIETGSIASEDEAVLLELEQSDDLFPHLSPEDWKP
jgi:1,4-alpha-glucan branching enzyme